MVPKVQKNIMMILFTQRVRYRRPTLLASSFILYTLDTVLMFKVIFKVKMYA